MFPSLLIHVLLIVGLPVATWHQRDVIREAVADVPRWMWGALAALLAPTKRTCRSPSYADSLKKALAAACIEPQDSKWQ